MTSSLYWKPINTDRNYLPDALKYVLKKRCQSEAVDIVLSNADIPYLEALCDANIEGARELLQAIQEHGTIHVTEEF